MNRAGHGALANTRTRERVGGNATGVAARWFDGPALRKLLQRAAPDLSGESGGYVTVAVVGHQRREEQLERWAWSDRDEALNHVLRIGATLLATASGLRVRVHRMGGLLVGSVLLRRPEAKTSSTGLRLRPTEFTQVDDARLSAAEAGLVVAMTRIAELERALAVVRGVAADVRRIEGAVEGHEERIGAVEALVTVGVSEEDEGDVDDDAAWDAEE